MVVTYRLPAHRLQWEVTSTALRTQKLSQLTSDRGLFRDQVGKLYKRVLSIRAQISVRWLQRSVCSG